MSTANASSKQGAGKRLGYLIGGLVISLIATFGILWYVNQEAAYDKERIGYTSEQQVLSQRIAKYALNAAGGSEDAFDQVVRYRDRFGETVGYLRNGNVATGLPPIEEEDLGHEELVKVEQTWAKFAGQVNAVLAGKDVVMFSREAVAAIQDHMARLQENDEAVVDILVKTGASRDVIRRASRQLMLAQRIAANVGNVLTGRASEADADAFADDVEEYGTVMEGMVRGNSVMPMIENEAVQAKLFDGSMLFKIVSDYVEEMLDSSEELLAVQHAASEAAGLSDELFAASLQLQNALALAPQQRLVQEAHAYGFGAIALIFLIMLGWTLKSDADRRSRLAEEANKKNQEAILRLLDEMGNLADGDLTRYATVTEDFTGAIADSINFTIDALRDVVTTINTTSEQVSGAAEQTRKTAMNLADASEHQAQEITSAVTAINEMAMSINEVSENSKETADLAQKSVEIANKGGKTVRRTIEGMDAIREHIQETSKRIKRLGESSQEIGDIVELINDIAEQTNILALNAAIQAAMAGEAGRGFAVVADEVQRLAERSSNATKQIEALVKTIQTDTNEAVISMEQSTAGVVNGARLAEDAGEALEEIVSVSTHLAELIENISSSAAQQSKAAANITQTMNVIQEITTQTNAGTNETAASIGNLTELANDLRKSVAGFKLPE